MRRSTQPDARSDLIRGPKWRTRTTPGRRHGAAAATFSLVVAVGIATLVGVVWLLGRVDPPGWLLWLPWWLPTAGTVAWTLWHPTVAALTDDDDDSWFGYSIRWALVGEAAPRPVAVRIAAAVLFGAAVVWAILVSGVLTLTGIL